MASIPPQEAEKLSPKTKSSENSPNNTSVKSNVNININKSSNIKDQEAAKRKRSEASSTSELETSATEVKKTAAQKQKKKKKKEIDSTCINETNMEETEKKGLTKDIEDLIKQTRQINSKLERLDGCMNRVNNKLETVMMKGDTSIRETLKDLITEMKDDLLKSVINRIEHLEGKMFDREQEYDKLKESIKSIDKTVLEKNLEKENIEESIRKQGENIKKLANDTEQYSRRNNIKIRGLPDTDSRETALDSAKKVVKYLKEKEIASLSLSDIDIAHRLPNTDNKNRDIIVRFVSRLVRDEVISQRRKLKNTGVFINEDLTRLNLHVLMCIKKKMSDEVEDAWTVNGTIRYKDKAEKIIVVRFEDYQEWIDLPWP